VTELRIRVVGENLPGRRFEEHSDVHVGLQIDRDVPDPIPGDADVAVFEVTVTRTDDQDFRGKAVHGRRGARFLYLSWGDLSSGQFVMFRRAKLHLSAIPAGELTGGLVEGRLGLTDGRGGPRCASVRPPVINWRALG
jgi:hypothetical protein